MPLFDFLCASCGRVSELLVRSGPEPACPHCGSRALSKQVSQPAAPGRSADIVASARRQAAREGHFSHYSAAERRRT